MCHQGDDGARVHAATQKRAHGHVADHVTLHGVGQLRPEALDPLALRHAGIGREAEAPVLGDHGFAALQRQDEGAGRRELPDGPEDAPGRGHIVESQVLAERVEVQIARDGRVLENALDFRGEEEPLPVPGVHEGLDAGPVPREHQAPGALVEDGEGEHAAQAPHAVRALGLVGPQDHLGVRCRAEASAARLQVSAQLAEVVDLAVEDDAHRSIITDHGLIARGQIDDGETPVTEPGRTAADDGLAIRTPVCLNRCHGLQERAVHGAPCQIDDAGDATHC